MRFIKYFLLLSVYFSDASISSFAQSGLTVSAGSSIFISGGAVFSVDSLVLTPSGSYTINGANAETRDAAITHPSANPYIQRVFHFTNTLSVFSGDITFYYQDAELNSIPESELTLNVNDGTLWHAFTQNTTRDAVNNIVTVTGLTNMSMNELTLANVLAPLPIAFISINTDCLSSGEKISWATAQELNSKNFIIEKSKDATNWQNIGTVTAAGYSNDERNYVFTDNKSSGLAYYRIAENDLDGRQTISAIVKTSCTISETFAIHPNPVRDIVFINFTTTESTPVMLKLYDVQGGLIQQIETNLPKGVSQLQLNMSGVSAGTYMLLAQWGDNTKTSKIVKE